MGSDCVCIYDVAVTTKEPGETVDRDKLSSMKNRFKYRIITYFKEVGASIDKVYESQLTLLARELEFLPSNPVMELKYRRHGKAAIPSNKNYHECILTQSAIDKIDKFLKTVGDDKLAQIKLNNRYYVLE